MPPAELPPHLSPVQRRAALGSFPPVPKRCLVTGGTGIVGMRLVEMLVERGADRVVCMDIVPKENLKVFWDTSKIEYVVGDVANPDDVEQAIGSGVDCVWHLAASVGPFHPTAIYEKVNHQGTRNVIASCLKHQVKLVYSSSPSTRFPKARFMKPDFDGPTEADMPAIPLADGYMQEYAKTKALGEIAMREAVANDGLLAVAVAPHQVYGPRDTLFLPNLLEAAGSGKLRVFGPGDNRICFTHIDNYAHGLIIAERKLVPKSPVLGKFYIVTDGNTHPHAPKAYCEFWTELDKAVVAMGFVSLWSKFKLPFALLFTVAFLGECLGWLTGVTFKLNRFNVFMLTINRWFDITAAETELEFQPIIAFEEGWQDTIAWFKEHWLPGYLATVSESKASSMVGIAKGSQTKINIQAKGTLNR